MAQAYIVSNNKSKIVEQDSTPQEPLSKIDEYKMKVVHYYHDKTKHFLKDIDNRYDMEMKMIHAQGDNQDIGSDGSCLKIHKPSIIKMFYETMIKTELEYVDNDISVECFRIENDITPYYTHPDVFSLNDPKCFTQREQKPEDEDTDFKFTLMSEDIKAYNPNEGPKGNKYKVMSQIDIDRLYSKTDKK